MIQWIPNFTPYVDMSSPIYMSKVAFQEFVVHNNIQTCGIATASTDDSVITCTDDSGSTCTKKRHRNMRRDDHERTCTCDHRSTCKYLSTDSTGMHGSTCYYISTEIMGMNRGTSMDISTGKTVIRGSTCTYDYYRMHQPRRVSIDPCRKHIVTDSVVKVRKGFGYTDVPR